MGARRPSQWRSRSSTALALAATMAASASWAAACSSFADAGAGDPPTDAGSVPDANANVDADAVVPDAGSAPDGAAPRLACDSGPLVLCDDFEGVLGARWTTKSIVLPGALQLLPATAPAVGQVLRVSIAGDAGTGTAMLNNAFSMLDTRGFTCDFDLTPQGLPSPPGSRPKLFTFSIDQSATSELAGLYGYLLLDASGSYLVTQSKALNGVFVSGPESDKPAFPVTGTSHLSLDLDLDASMFSVSLNGTPLHSISLAGTMKKNNGVHVGLGTDGIARPVAYDIDNVVCSVR